MPKPKYYFEVYQDKKKHYRWRLRARNKKIVTDSAEGYVKRSHCFKMIENIISYIYKIHYNELLHEEPIPIYENDVFVNHKGKPIV